MRYPPGSALGIDSEGANARDGKRVKATEAVGERTQFSYTREAADETADRGLDLGAAQPLQRGEPPASRPLTCWPGHFGPLTGDVAEQLRAI